MHRTCNSAAKPSKNYHLRAELPKKQAGLGQRPQKAEEVCFFLANSPVSALSSAALPVIDHKRKPHLDWLAVFSGLRLDK